MSPGERYDRICCAVPPCSIPAVSRWQGRARDSRPPRQIARPCLFSHGGSCKPVRIMQNTSAIREVLTAGTGSGGGTAIEYRLAPHVVLALAWDGSSRLIDVGDHCYALPVLATTLLATTLQEGKDAAVSQVASRCVVPPERVRKDLDVFLTNLLRRGLLTRAAGHGRPRKPLRQLVACSLAGLLRWLLRKSPSGKRTARSDRRRAGALLAMAHASLKILGWAQTVELWQATSEAPPDAAISADPARLEQVPEAIRRAVSRSLFPVDCKARALCCWAMLRSAGHPARLLVGIDLFPFLGHCWCESASGDVNDGGDRAGRFTPVLQYA
jgi:hypothetical protein